jgi:DNA-binding transcriptional ArsR family regulator
MPHPLAPQFAALGDPTRLAIIDRLIAEGPQPAGALQDVAEISAPAISRHLKVLRAAGLVQQQVDAQRRIYSVNPQAIRAIGTWSITRRDFWKGSLDRLTLLLDADKD